MARKYFYSHDEDSDEIVKKYEDFVSGVSPAGYFDVEEFETIIDHYLFLENIDVGNKVLEMGLKQHPTSSELQAKRAKIHLLRDDPHGAFDILTSLTEQDDYDVVLLKIDALLKMERDDEAIAVYEHFFATINSNSYLIESAYLNVAQVYMHYRKYDKALKLLEKGNEINPRSIDILFEISHCYEHLQNIDKALEVQLHITEINPFVSEAWFNLGQIYLSMQNYTKAIDAYDYAIAINPKDMHSCLQKAHILLQLERYHEAIEIYVECAETTDSDDNKALIYGYIGECYEYLKDSTKAVLYYQKSLELEPESYDSLVGLGLCMLEQEKYSEGMVYLQKAIEIEPEFYEAYTYLAEGYIGLDDLENALLAYQKSLEYEPNQPETLVAVGNILLEQEDFVSALLCYQVAYEQNRELEQVHLFLAIGYFKLEQFEESIAHLLEAVTADSEALSAFLEICPEAADLMGIGDKAK